MKKSLFLLIFAILCVTIGCKRKSSAGLGGQAKVKISIQHHNTIIDTGNIYIKFNADESPLTIDEYDLVQQINTDTMGNSFTIFEGLKKGEYYIYASGWDFNIAKQVTGGIPYNIVTESDINIVIPVSELH